MAPLKKLMYVRCPIDTDYIDEPRDFILGQIINIDEFAETAEVVFYDIQNIRQYFQIPDKMTFNLSKLMHCRIESESVVEYFGKLFKVKSYKLNKEDDMYYYYLTSFDNKIVHVCEDSVAASFNCSSISPGKQMINYEFQNPMWYFGRTPVNKTTHDIDNSIYGLKELAGCKIFLKPHQLKTALRCLSDKNCRYMIADEVGMGKTIETISVIKIFLSDKRNQKVLIVVPDALVEQWKTELAFKFKLFDGKNANNNNIVILPLSRIWLAVPGAHYDFLVVDEVHKILNDTTVYNKALQLSKSIDNVLMLSATPVQSRNEEYHKLLSLIQPAKYADMSEEHFQRLLEMQNSIVRMVSDVQADLDSYKEAIEDSNYEHDEDTADIFEELVDSLDDIAGKTKDKHISEKIDKLDYDADNFSLPQIEGLVAYICESYQLEKCVIRNRRPNDETSNKRELIEVSYDIEADFNNTEYRIYALLSQWIESKTLNTSYDVFPLIESFFSSSAAFRKSIENYKDDIPREIFSLTDRWCLEEKKVSENIVSSIDNFEDSMSRIMSVVDYIDQETYDKKVIVFTHYSETFSLYKTAFENYFGAKACAFFCKGMKAEELELNTYRFQTVENCRILLSDETGGEGRNFQNADQLINIDLPWSANTIEQRIGRLDRIGREPGKPVVTVSVFAENTVEESLHNIWNNGLKIFNKSQSGLEIIMNDIDKKIKEAVRKDFKYGLSYIVKEIENDIVELEKQVRKERHFDLAAYQFQELNRQIENHINRYQKEESTLFQTAMMSWAALAGFKGNMINDDAIRFTASSFSCNSARNTLFIPPDMKALIDSKMNQMQNSVRIMNGDKEIKKDPNIIQGTFNRESALKNDYLNFFAPGEEIFDSIVNNAVYSYKGKSAAFAFYAPIEWEGFVLNWYITPDERILLKNNIHLKAINQYKGYLTSDIISVFIPINANDTDTKNVRKCYDFISQMKTSEIKQVIENFGQRSNKNGFLRIPDTYFMSNLDWFKNTYPEEVWEELVKEVCKKGKAAAKEEVSKRTSRSLKRLKAAMQTRLNSDKAAAEYFGELYDESTQKRVNDIIFKAFLNSKLVLDSMCYVRMIKNV